MVGQDPNLEPAEASTTSGVALHRAGHCIVTSSHWQTAVVISNGSAPRPRPLGPAGHWHNDHDSERSRAEAKSGPGRPGIKFERAEAGSGPQARVVSEPSDRDSESESPHCNPGPRDTLVTDS